MRVAGSIPWQTMSMIDEQKAAMAKTHTAALLQ